MINDRVTTPAELRRIADAAERYEVRTVKTCVGEEFCRFGLGTVAIEGGWRG